MNRQCFLIKGVRYYAGDDALQLALERIYNTNESPYCMCRPSGVQMYVAKYSQFVIKRLPETGPQHHPACPAYELPPTESGLGELIGQAIVERNLQSVSLRVDFPLVRLHGRSVRRGESGPVGEVQAARPALSLRGMTHWLWEQAGLNRWYPNMQGRRHWATVRKHLIEQARHGETKGSPLHDVLLLPEPFNLEDKDAQVGRRREALRVLDSPLSDVQHRMMIVLGELNDVQESPIGRRVLVKHMPETPLLVDDDTWKRVQHSFLTYFEAKAADPQLRLILSALIYAKREQVYFIDRASLMLTTETWIPVETPSEAALVRHLTLNERSFLKPLRYESKRFAQFPNVKLLDAGDEGTYLDIVGGVADEKDRNLKLKALQGRPPGSWTWNVAESMPALPPKRVRVHTGSMRDEARAG